MKTPEQLLQMIANGGSIDNTLPKLSNKQLRRLFIHLIQEAEPSDWSVDIQQLAMVEMTTRFLNSST